MKYLFILLSLISLTNIALCDTLKIAIIDTGLDLKDPRFKEHLCKQGHKDFTGSGLEDIHGHGTHVAGLIQQNAGNGNYCFLIYKYYLETSSGMRNLANEIAALKEAIKNHAVIVNISGGGPEFSQEEYEVLRNSPNTLFVSAAGNEHQDLDKPENFYYPASYFLPNIEIVGNIDKMNRRVFSSNWGTRVTNYEIGYDVLSTMPCKIKFFCSGRMTGTSQATAVHTGKIIRRILDGASYRK